MFGSGATDKLVQAIAQKTGLSPQGDRFVGMFQGLPAWTQTQMAGNMAGAVRGNGGALGGIGAFLGGSGGSMAHAMTGGTFFMKYDYVVDVPGCQWTGASIQESSSFMVDKSWQRRDAIGQRVHSGVQWIDSKFEVCANDPRFIQWVCASQEFQQCLNNWHFVNITWQGSTVWVEVLDNTTRVAGKWGAAAMQNGDMTLGGLWLAASAARATFAR